MGLYSVEIFLKTPTVRAWGCIYLPPPQNWELSTHTKLHDFDLYAKRFEIYTVLNDYMDLFGTIR